eukprot:scaffold4470_cov255-Prasinococcus_capsulatus_cf.AAC.17
MGPGRWTAGAAMGRPWPSRIAIRDAGTGACRLLEANGILAPSGAAAWPVRVDGREVHEAPGSTRIIGTRSAVEGRL